jgi:transcription elongation GreA/GreB family factor
MTQATTTAIYLSKKGMKELKKQINRTELHRAKIVAELREQERTNGREERLARIEKLSQLESVENDLLDLRYQLEHAKPLPRKRDTLGVALGSVVDLMDQQGRLIRYTLVNSIEANPSDGRLSILSPLGQSLIGKTAQQTIEWTTSKLQGNPMRLTLVRIS